MAPVFRSLSAALAAGLLALLGACSGGDETPLVQAQSASPEVVQALSGPAVPDREGILAVSAPASQVQPKFSLTAEMKVKGTSSVTREQKLENVAEVSPVDKLFDWAEGAFPTLFPGHKTSVKLVAGVEYTLRYYPETQNYVGVTPDGGIYGLGPYTGNALKYLGHICDVPVTVDSCRPKVLSTSPSNGDVDVSAKGTSVVYVFGNASYVGDGINCAGIGGTTEVGTAVKVVVTVTCRPSDQTVTITPMDGRLPYGIEACFTLGGVQNSTGLGSPSFTTCFTTRAVEASGQLYVANDSPAVLDVVSGAVTPVVFPPVPGFVDLRNVAVDPLMGKAYFAGLGTYRLYSIDLETSQVLEPIAIDPDFQYSHVVQGLMVTESEVCMAFARADVQGYPRHNQLDCRSLTTGKQGFLSQRNFLAADGMLTTTLRYLPYGTEKKAYALATAKDSYFLEVYDSNTGGIREGYLSGKAGVVTEVDMVTHQTRTWKVGSVPQGIDRDPTTGDLYVVNSGDRSLSIIRASSGEVQTFSLASSFVGYQRPMRIKIDQARQRFYVTDYLGAVIAFNLADRKEEARAPVGVLTIDLTYTSSGKLAVTSMEGTVVLLDLGTFKEVKRFSDVGLNIYSIASGQ